MQFRSPALAAVLSLALPSCIVVDVDRTRAAAEASTVSQVCSARHGGEADHLIGERWFDGTDWCTCVDLAGEPVTRCRDTCDDEGVHFSDTEGVVCSCERSTWRLSCAADANDGECPCLCDDPDGDGICR